MVAEMHDVPADVKDFVELPEDVVLEVFCRVPVKDLARSQLVSIRWLENWNINIKNAPFKNLHDQRVQEPTPILFHYPVSSHKGTCSLCFHAIEADPTYARDIKADPTYVWRLKKDPFMEFFRKTPLPNSPDRHQIDVQGSCDGLIFLTQNDSNSVTSLVVIDTLRKEYYNLPDLNLWSDGALLTVSCCGLGLDASNTWKMVCVLSNNHTMVHVIDTNSWKQIDQVPPYPTKGEAVFANGCLFWLAIGRSSDKQPKDIEISVIWFDVKEEVFKLTDGPKRTCDGEGPCPGLFDHLVNLNGDVGYVCCRTMGVWILNKQKEWMPHCRFDKKNVYFNNGMRVLGCWNKDGDILIRNIGYSTFFVYNLKSGVLHNTSIVGPFDGYSSPKIIMQPNKLFSIHGISKKTFPMEQTYLTKNCQRLISINKNSN